MSKTIKCDKCHKIICEDIQNEYNQNYYSFSLGVEFRNWRKNDNEEFKVSNVDLCTECGTELVLILKEKLPESIYKGLT